MFQTNSAKRTSSRAPHRVVLYCAAGFAAVLAGCTEQNAYVEPPPPEVTVALPVQQDVTNYFETTGTTQPVMLVDIRARVRGFLKERHFQEGSLVKAGQLLFVIDEEPFRVQLEQTRIRQTEAEAALKKARQSRAREVAKAQLALDESQLALAKIVESRQRSLIERGASTREELDQAEANRKKAAAQVEATRAQMGQANADYDNNILAAEANAGAARTAVQNAEIELGYCRMYSPIDGRISRLNLNIGNLVGDGEASLLATVVSLDPVYAYINVSENDLLGFRKNIEGDTSDDPNQKGAVMELGLANETGYPHQGHIDYRDPAVDPGTGTLRVRGVFSNTDGTILPGMFVHIRIPSGTQTDALLVPDRALGTDQSGQYLLVVGDKNIVEYRPVKVGSLVGEMRVVEGKIGPKDRVVIEGLLRARPKIPVIPKFESETKEAVAARSDAADAS